MFRFSPSQLRHIEELLHEATLQSANWDRMLGTLTARFNCLRGNADASEMGDRTVEFKLTGAAAVAVGYDSPRIETRPSQFLPPRRISERELADWPFRTQEATLSINSAAIEDALDAARLDWNVGNEVHLRASPCTFCLLLDQWRDFGLPVINVWLVAGGEDFTITAAGTPLDLDEWSRQYDAWWKGWREHWDAKGADTDDGAGAYDTFIPAGKSEPPDLSYRPPAEPIFELEPTDVPPNLIRPVRDWFEARHERDWVRMAQAFPAPDVPAVERARRLEEGGTSWEFGRWDYVRGIDQWWQEGRRGWLEVRGIQHKMLFDGESAENRETVWSFALRHRGGQWIIDTFSQGWPGFGSAPKLEATRKPWLKRWRSGRVRT